MLGIITNKLDVSVNHTKQLNLKLTMFLFFLSCNQRHFIEPHGLVILCFPIGIYQIIAKRYKQKGSEESGNVKYAEGMTEWQQPENFYSMVLYEIVCLTHACNVMHILLPVDERTNGYEE